MKKFITFVIVFMLVISMVACGGAKVDPNDPNQGMWRATTGEMFGLEANIEDFFEQGFTIELKAKGKCTLTVDGKKANGTWALNNGAFTVKGGGINCQGRLENGKLTLEDVLGSGLKLIFEKEGGYTGAAADVPADVGYYIIDSVVQGGETFDSDMLKDMGINYYVRLNEDGSAEISTDITINGTWKAGKINYKENGEDVFSEYTLSGDELTIWLGSADVKLVFKRSNGGAEPSISGGSDKNLNEKLAWWDGDWYGYWTVVSADDPYLNLKGGVWDCYCTIDVREDNTATVTWWDDEMLLGEVEIALSFEGYQVEIGLANSTGGTLFGDPIQDEAWYITPDSSDYKNMIQLDEWYEDINGDSLRYKAFLRPWGMLWDDVPEDERSPGYDWYLDSKQLTMDEALGGESSEQTPAPAPGGATESGGGGATDVSYELVDFKLSLTLPSGDWIDQGITGGASGGVTTAHFYYKETHANAPRVDITESFTMSSFDSYKNYWDNYSDIASKTIAGIDMEGRTYTAFGMKWIDYIGKIGADQYVGVTIIDLDPESGETKALLDSIKLD